MPGRSLSVPLATSSVRPADYDSPMVYGGSPAPDLNRRPLPYHAGKGFADDLATERKSRREQADDAFVRELARALESEDEQAQVPSRFPRRWVYFIQRGPGGPIKIGYTTRDPEERMRDFQTACPERLVLVGYVPVVGKEVETWMHRQLDAHRLGGEWFKPEKPVLQYAALAAAIDGRRRCETKNVDLAPEMHAVLAVLEGEAADAGFPSCPGGVS